MELITIELNDLHFFAKLGLYEEEGKIENEFIVNIAISYQAPKKVIHSLSQTINYVEVYRMVQQEFNEKKELLETCAMLIAQRITDAYDFIKVIAVHIRKMNPPIENFSGAVSVSYTKRFK